MFNKLIVSGVCSILFSVTAFASSTNILPFNRSLSINEKLTSTNQCFSLVLQKDGNMVVYQNRTGQPLWASGTWHKRSSRATMQLDGNFVIYDAKNNPLWASGSSWGYTGSYLIMQNDGNLVIYTSDTWQPVWASDTGLTPC